MVRGKRDFTVLALLALLAGLIYANSLHNPFVIDDQSIIVRNFLLRQWTLADIMKSHLFSTVGVETQYYRPLTLLTFAINYDYSELNPAGYRIVNIALHLIVVTLLYLLLARFVSPWVVGFCAALFSVHPANVQAVSYISSRSDPLYTVLTLSCILSWAKGNWAQGIEKLFFRSFSVILFFLGLLAKETAIVAPALIILTDWIWHNDRAWKEKVTQNWGWYLAFGIALGVYITIRAGAGYALNMEGSLEAWKAGRELALWPRILLALKLLGLYLAFTLYPLNLSFFRDVPIPQGPLEASVVLGLLALALMIAIAFFSWPSRREITYGIVWFLVSILPVLNLTSLNAPMMEHWLYLPLIGFALAFVGCIHALGRRWGEVRGSALGLVLLFILLSARTVMRNAEWGNPIRLFLSGAQHFPNDEKNWLLLGFAFSERGMPDQAIRAYKTGLGINPNHAYGWSGLGEALSASRKDDDAEKSFLTAISIMPKNPWLHYVLGIHRLKTGKINGAIEALNQAVTLTPPLPLAYHVLGSAYLRDGKKDKAEEAFRKVLSFLPQTREIHAAVHVELGKVYFSRGKLKEAEEEWRIALRFDPNEMEAKKLLRKETRNPQPRAAN